jgi:hypothetical protein
MERVGVTLMVTVGIGEELGVRDREVVGQALLVTQVDREKLGVPLREDDTVGDVHEVGERVAEGDGV